MPDPHPMPEPFHILYIPWLISSEQVKTESEMPLEAFPAVPPALLKCSSTPMVCDAKAGDDVISLW